MPLDNHKDPLDQLLGDLQKLAPTADSVPGDCQAALDNFTAALDISLAYQFTAGEILKTTDELGDYVNKTGTELDAYLKAHPSSDRPTTDEIQAIIFQLRLKLIELRGVRATMQAAAQPLLAVRADGLIARVESAEDLLSLQNVSVQMSNYKKFQQRSAAPAVNEQFDAIQGSWSADAIKGLSPVNLANRLVDAINALNGVIALDRNLVTPVRNDTTGFLYLAISAILRQILNRFFYAQQAGIPNDTQLRHGVEPDFQALRDVLNPIIGIDVQADKLKTVIATQVGASVCRRARPRNRQQDYRTTWTRC